MMIQFIGFLIATAGLAIILLAKKPEVHIRTQDVSITWGAVSNEKKGVSINNVFYDYDLIQSIMRGGNYISLDVEGRIKKSPEDEIKK